MDTQWTWGPGLARRPDVRSRFRRSGEHPMDLGYLVDRRPDLRWRGGPDRYTSRGCPLVEEGRSVTAVQRWRLRLRQRTWTIIRAIRKLNSYAREPPIGPYSLGSSHPSQCRRHTTRCHLVSPLPPHSEGTASTRLSFHASVRLQSGTSCSSVSKRFGRGLSSTTLLDYSPGTLPQCTT